MAGKENIEPYKYNAEKAREANARSLQPRDGAPTRKSQPPRTQEE